MTVPILFYLSERRNYEEPVAEEELVLPPEETLPEDFIAEESSATPEPLATPDEDVHDTLHPVDQRA